MAKLKKGKIKKKRMKRKKVSGTKKEKRCLAKGAKKMSRAELKKYKALLLKEREDMSGNISHIAQNTLNKSQREASGDLSGYSYHMADMATDDYDRDFSLGRVSDEQKVIYLIDEALKRVAEGTYGLCLICGKPIAKKRLKALPYSESCIECQKKNEGQ